MIGALLPGAETKVGLHVVKNRSFPHSSGYEHDDAIGQVATDGAAGVLCINAGRSSSVVCRDVLKEFLISLHRRNDPQ